MHTQGSLSEALSYDAASVSSLSAANAPTTGGVLMRVAGAGYLCAWMHAHARLEYSECTPRIARTPAAIEKYCLPV